MTVKAKYRLCLFFLLAAVLAGGVFLVELSVRTQIPDRYLLYQNKEQRLSFPIPVSATITECRQKEDEHPSDLTEIHTPVVTGLSLHTRGGGNYNATLKAFGVIPIKQMGLTVTSDQKVTACGQPVGIYLKTKGVLVLDTGEFTDRNGQKVAPANNILEGGDNILKINDKEIKGKSHFMQLIEDSQGNRMTLTIMRNNVTSRVSLTPAMDEQGVYKLGIWVRDSAQGIGTITYFNKDGEYAALGHAITDADTGYAMALGKGSIYQSDILSIEKGKKDKPGQLTGILTFDSEDYLGPINQNEINGIYGCMEPEKRQNFLENSAYREYPLALKQELEQGDAYILNSLSGEEKLYRIHIDKASYDINQLNRGIRFTVTDPQLIQLCGGIVQGMSGSPIIQNDKLIGAVTHVFIDDPTKGYGIFIEEMIKEKG